MSGWKGWSGRQEGGSKYAFGDLTRGLLSKVGQGVAAGVKAGAKAVSHVANMMREHAREQERMRKAASLVEVRLCSELARRAYDDAQEAADEGHRMELGALQQARGGLVQGCGAILSSTRVDGMYVDEHFAAPRCWVVCVQTGEETSKAAMQPGEPAEQEPGGVTLVIVFRGTVQPLDWVVNVNADTKPLCEGVHDSVLVHGGVLDSLNAGNVDSCAASIATILHERQGQEGALPVKRVLVTGHSLGGAYATIMLLLLRRSPKLQSLLTKNSVSSAAVTFGAPLVVAVPHPEEPGFYDLHDDNVIDNAAGREDETPQQRKARIERTVRARTEVKGLTCLVHGQDIVPRSLGKHGAVEQLLHSDSFARNFSRLAIGLGSYLIGKEDSIKVKKGETKSGAWIESRLLHARRYQASGCFYHFKYSSKDDGEWKRLFDWHRQVLEKEPLQVGILGQVALGVVKKRLGAIEAIGHHSMDLYAERMHMWVVK